MNDHAAVVDPLHPVDASTESAESESEAAAAAAAQQAAVAAVAYHDQHHADETAYNHDPGAVAVAVAAADEFVGAAVEDAYMAYPDPHRQTQTQDSGVDELGHHVSKRRRLLGQEDDDSLHVHAMDESGAAEMVDANNNNNATAAASAAMAAASALDMSDVGRRKNTNFPPPKKLNHEQWDLMFNRLLAYKERYGDTLVAKRYADDPKLGTWVETQRVQYKKCVRVSRQSALDQGIVALHGTSIDELVPGQDFPIIPSKRLNAERLNRLNEIQFTWSARPGRASSKKIVSVEDNEGGIHNGYISHQPLESIGDGRSSLSDMNSDDISAYAQAAAVMDTEEVGVGTGTIPALDQLEMTHQHQDSHLPPHDHEKPRGSSKASSAALARHYDDSEWDILYDRLSLYKEQHGNCLVPRQYSKDRELGKFTEAMRAQYNQEIEGSNDGMRREMDVSTTAAPADTTFPLPQPRQESDGLDHLEHLDPMDSTNSAGFQEMSDTTGLLGAGVTVDADIGAKSKLKTDRWAKLEALGFEWSIRGKKRESWEDMFTRLCQYKDDHGDTLVPSKYDADPRLGKWVEAQRYEHTKLLRAMEETAKAVVNEETNSVAPSDSLSVGKEKKKRSPNSRLTEDRIAQLESIGFQWKAKNKMKKHTDKLWNGMLAKLLQYKEEHDGDCNVPRSHSDNKLASWVHSQRLNRRKLIKVKAKQDAGENIAHADLEVLKRLTPEREQILEDAGFIWEVQKEPKPKKRASVADGLLAEPPKQQTKKTTGTKKASGASTKTAKENAHDIQWEDMYLRLARYKEEKKDCLVPKRYEADKKLGCWVDTQRVQYRKLQKKLAELDAQSGNDNEAKANAVRNSRSRLTPERMEKLEALGFVWSLRDNWETHLSELVQFKNEHGHCDVPSKYPPSQKLSFWVMSQRQVYKAMEAGKDTKKLRGGKLTKERVDALNALGFNWSIRSENFCERDYTHFVEEQQEVNGNAVASSVPAPSVSSKKTVTGAQESGGDGGMERHRLLLAAVVADETLIAAADEGKDEEGGASGETANTKRAWV